MGWVEIGNFINVFADACAILTAVIASWFYFRVRCGESDKKTKVEKYLQTEKLSATGDDKGQKTILNIVANVGLTEEEVLHASFHSKKIRRLLKSDKEGYAAAILLWYEDDTSRK